MSCVSFTHAHPNDTETLLTVLSTTEVVDIALSLVMGYRLCYTHAVEVQPYLVHRPAKCPLLQSTVVF